MVIAQEGLLCSPQVALNSQAVSQSNARASPQVVRQASPADSSLPQVESADSQATVRQTSLVDSPLPQAGSTISQASQADSTLSLAESEVSQAGKPKVTPAVRHSARLRALHASQNNSQTGNSQAGNSPLADSAISQLDRKASQVGSFQASVSQMTSRASSQEARPSPQPNRHNSLQGSSPSEEPNPKWIINLSSKPLTKAQRSVLAKSPNFVVSPKHPPNIEYITAIEAACTKLSKQDAKELRANINQVLRASHPPSLI